VAKIRLQKLLAQAGIASRRRAEDMIRAGEVTVGGAVVTELGISVDPQHDRVEVHGKRVRPEEPQYRVILKPRACLATLAKPRRAPLIAQPWRASSPTSRSAGPWWRRSTSWPRA
jgi:23S rRNA pseudouridine2605 synthase